MIQEWPLAPGHPLPGTPLADHPIALPHLPVHQTLITIGALAIALLLALSSQESVVHMEERQVQAEIETMAGQAALNVLAHIAAQPFDDATAAGTVSSVDDLTTAAAFPTGLAFADADDVDDFHRMATHTYTGFDGVAFDVDAEVRYVGEDLQPSATPTYQKEVTVRVGHERLARDVEVSRIISWP